MGAEKLPVACTPFIPDISSRVSFKQEENTISKSAERVIEYSFFIVLWLNEANIIPL
jgi:hypothetical protein